jgi:predicted 2-oxoglutarate/Fe(II)-dependent dioxygenase YbiX
MQLIKKPYLHYIKENFFKPRPFSLLNEFILNASWDFFEDKNFPQYISRRKEVEELFLSNPETHPQLSYLLSEDFIRKLERFFSFGLSGCSGISFHKLTKDCFNVIHNDSNLMGERVRVVCYLSSPSNYEGGELNLFTLSNQVEPYISYKLSLNSAFIFAMTEDSVHSVSKVTSGERICLVLTYR